MKRFKKRECNCFVPRPLADPSEAISIRRCHCGKDIGKHYPAVLEETSTTEWKVEDCTQSNDETDAFGEIRFAGRTASASTAQVT